MKQARGKWIETVASNMVRLDRDGKVWFRFPIQPTLRKRPDQRLSPELEYTIQWFENQIAPLVAQHARLGHSLYWYKLGFWAFVLIAVGMVLVLGLITEVLG